MLLTLYAAAGGLVAMFEVNAIVAETEVGRREGVPAWTLRIAAILATAGCALLWPLVVISWLIQGASRKGEM
jgi:hypothetical protein